jgi:hypothetical protein
MPAKWLRIELLGDESCGGGPGLIRFQLAEAMSALETTVRVSPEKQTLILAGETIPRRNFDSLSNRPLTIVATPADETLLLNQDGERARASALVANSRNFAPHSSAAHAYLSAQALSSPRSRTHLVDLYA